MRELTIIIPYFNGEQYIEPLLDSIPENIPVIIVDDLSTKPYQTNRQNTKVYRLDQKGYFAGAVNFGIKQCDTDVLILNQDSILSNGWQENITNHHDMIGERIKGNHPLFPHGYIHGTFMYISRELINNIGLLNQELYPLWGNTAEYQLRASRAGYKVLPLETVRGFTHFRGEKESFGSSIKQLLQKQPNDKSKLINTPPEISVIIPCYNYAHYLDDAINSLLGGETCIGTLPPQTMQSFEIIIVDDGSNEENQEKINSYVDGWNGVRVIRLDRIPLDENGKYIGKPSALNVGINKAIGKYITVLDCDDMMDSRRLETLYRLAIQNPHSVIYDQLLSFKKTKINTGWLNEKGLIYTDTENLTLGEETSRLSGIACENPKHTSIGNKLAFRFWPLPDYNFEQLIYKNCMHSGILFSKKAWQEIGGYNEKMQYGREDWCINIALGLHGYCGIKAEQPFYLYRREGQNRTLENTKPEWQKRFNQQIRSIYPNVYKGERSMACCGKGAKPTVRTQNFLVGSQLKNKEGLTYLVYKGARVAHFSVWGNSTGHQYRVNPKNPVFLVENEDLHKKGNKAGLLDLYEGTRVMFEVYNYVEPTIETVGIEEITTEVQKTALTDKHLNALKTNDKLRHFLLTETFTLQELELMLTYEIENKNRKTAIALLELNIDEYDGSRLFESSNV